MYIPTTFQIKDLVNNILEGGPVVCTHGNLYVLETCLGIQALQVPNSVMAS